MHDFVSGCAARSAGRALDPPLTQVSAIPSALPATASYFRADVAPLPRRPPATFLARQNGRPATANAPAPLGRSRCPVFEARKVLAPSPQTRVAGKSAHYPWLSFPFQSQDTSYHARNPLPILGLHGKPLLAPRRDRVKFGLAVVPGRPPLRSDPPLLQHAQQRRIHRTFVQTQYVAADLLDSPSNPEPVLRPQRMKRLQNHQVQRPLQHFRLLCVRHGVLPLHSPKEATISPLQCQQVQVPKRKRLGVGILPKRSTARGGGDTGRPFGRPLACLHLAV